MKLPARPPAFTDLFGRALGDHETLAGILTVVDAPTVDGEYVHWDRLQHLPPPVAGSRQKVRKPTGFPAQVAAPVSPGKRRGVQQDPRGTLIQLHLLGHARTVSLPPAAG